MGIGVILFDLGNVLVNFSNEPIARGLARWATRDPYNDPEKLRHYLFHPEHGTQNPFDEGRISPEGFFDHIQRELGLRLDFHGFVEIWNPIIEARPTAERLVRFLKGQRVEMYLLSNTNALHFQRVLNRFPWIRLIDSWFLSYRLGCRKPSSGIYKYVLSKLMQPPARILYLDDREENLSPARELGMKVVRIAPETSLCAVLHYALPHLPWDQLEGVP